MLSVVNINESQKWDGIVQSFKNYDIYYLSGYSKTCQINGDGEPKLFYFEDRNFKAINVVLLRDIAKYEKFVGKLSENTYFDSTTPYGYGGFIIEGVVTEDSIQMLFDEYSSLCMKYGIISEFVRFHPLYNNLENLKGVYNTSLNREVVYIDLESEEEIWNNMKTTSRNRIRKGFDLGIYVVEDTSEKSIKKFMDIYYLTMDKNNANSSYYFEKEYFDKLMKIKDACNIFNVMLDEITIASMIVLKGKDYMHYHLGATDPEYYSLSPNNLLFYEVAKWGHNNGYRKFHLGGGYSSSDDSLFRFKKTLNRKGTLPFFIGKRILNPEIYRKLVEIRTLDEKFNENTSFFPAYRG